MRAVGPDAPTLCGDWTTRDLAAHLVLRERRPDAAAGILIPAAGRLHRAQAAAAHRRTDMAGPAGHGRVGAAAVLAAQAARSAGEHHRDVHPPRRRPPRRARLAAAETRRRPGVRAAQTGAIRRPDVAESSSGDGDAARLRRHDAGVDRQRARSARSPATRPNCCSSCPAAMPCTSSSPATTTPLHAGARGPPRTLRSHSAISNYTAALCIVGRSS